MSEYVVEVNDYPSITINGYNVRGEYQYIQREKVVRCRDCKYVDYIPSWQTKWNFEVADTWQCRADWCKGAEGDHPLIEPDGFCKCGERRSR